MESKLYPLASRAMGILNQGYDVEYAEAAIAAAYPSASSGDIEDAVAAAYLAIESGLEAESGEYLNFADLPALAGVSGPIRVRLFIQGYAGFRPFTASLDVLATANSPISSIEFAAREYLQDIAQGRESLPGGRGDDYQVGEQEVTIALVMPEQEAFTKSEQTREA